MKTSERLADNPLFQEISLFSARDIRRMLDVEFASELLLVNIEGVTNKKDMLDDAYARFEIEFPEETRFESEFAAAITLIRSIIAPENVAATKTRSNFYSLYGACLRYHRATNRIAFSRPDDVRNEVGSLVIAARTGDIGGKPDYYRDYHEAVTRAASDRARRARREEILCSAIARIEGLQRM